MRVRHRGFSAVEILVAIAVVGILAAVIMSGFLGFREKRALAGDTEVVVTMLRDAWSKTLASQDASAYGVHFESSKAVLFKGTVYSAGSSDNDEYTLDNLIEIGTISLNGGGSEVVFNRLDGTTDEYGSAVLRLKSDTTVTRTITIERTGAIRED